MNTVFVGVPKTRLTRSFSKIRQTRLAVNASAVAAVTALRKNNDKVTGVFLNGAYGSSTFYSTYSKRPLPEAQDFVSSSSWSGSVNFRSNYRLLRSFTQHLLYSAIASPFISHHCNIHCSVNAAKMNFSTKPGNSLPSPTTPNNNVTTKNTQAASVGRMLRFENSLPKLPVPNLDETLKRYLRSVKAVISPEEYARTEKAVQEFLSPNGVGQELQNRLMIRYANSTVDNWLAEWWNEKAYLGFRDPVVPYVSYFYSHCDDPYQCDAAKRAAAITKAALEFKRLVDEKSLEPEYMRKQPLAMSSYEWMFNVCRIPAFPSDYPIKSDNLERDSHIIVIRRNRFFKVPHVKNGRETLNEHELETIYRKIYASTSSGPPVGILTTQFRDKWAKAREKLIGASTRNLENLRDIESASFVVCLDDANPITLEERAHQYWHGDGCNRWFDKPLQFIINDNGTSGFNGEHSMMDGTATHRLNDWICRYILTHNSGSSQPCISSNLPLPVELQFEINEIIMGDIIEAKDNFIKQVEKHDLKVVTIKRVGKDAIKALKCSPDGFVQMLIQLAYYRLTGVCRPTYESGATRKFKLGRTEACRSVSIESVNFCKAMNDVRQTDQQRGLLLREAIQAHVQYVSNASEGRGIDRHLFGLKMCLKPTDPVPSLFTDPAFEYSSHWYLSTSQLSSDMFNGYGWSEVVPEGWGIAYMINSKDIQLNLVSRFLGTAHFAYRLQEAADDMLNVLSTTLPSSSSTSSTSNQKAHL